MGKEETDKGNRGEIETEACYSLSRLWMEKLAFVRGRAVVGWV